MVGKVSTAIFFADSVAEQRTISELTGHSGCTLFAVTISAGAPALCRKPGDSASAVAKFVDSQLLDAKFQSGCGQSHAKRGSVLAGHFSAGRLQRHFNRVALV
jgi:hypothetical protein